MATTATSSATGGDLPEPTAAQQKVIDRIAAQRERLRARRAAQAQTKVVAQQRSAAGLPVDDALPLRAASFAREHPIAVAAMVGVGLVLGPRRLIRWTGFVLPLLMRLRR